MAAQKASESDGMQGLVKDVSEPAEAGDPDGFDAAIEVGRRILDPMAVAARQQVEAEAGVIGEASQIRFRRVRHRDTAFVERNGSVRRGGIGLWTADLARKAVAAARRLVGRPARAAVPPRVSVCIPAYEMHGRGAAFLARSLAALDRQTLQDIEVVVSDHSENDDLRMLCQKRRQPYRLRYVRYDIKRGNSTANTNNAVRHATGDVIKILHQDDFLFADDALERIVAALRAMPDRSWGGVGCIHVNETETEFYGPHVPRMDPAILQGYNGIGAPSVMFVRRKDFLEFDEELIWVGDCELYYRMTQALGEPILLDDLLVAVRQWPRQVTHTIVSEERKACEIRYATEKHDHIGRLDRIG
jgi:hypothetical protein